MSVRAVSKEERFVNKFFEKSKGLDLEKSDAKIKEMLLNIFQCNGSISKNYYIKTTGALWPALKIKGRFLNAEVALSVKGDESDVFISLHDYLKHTGKVLEEPNEMSDESI